MIHITDFHILHYTYTTYSNAGARKYLYYEPALAKSQKVSSPYYSIVKVSANLEIFYTSIDLLLVIADSIRGR